MKNMLKHYSYSRQPPKYHRKTGVDRMKKAKDDVQLRRSGELMLMTIHTPKMFTNGRGMGRMQSWGQGSKVNDCMVLAIYGGGGGAKEILAVGDVQVKLCFV
jgi:hypothetical protein